MLRLCRVLSSMYVEYSHLLCSKGQRPEIAAETHHAAFLRPMALRHRRLELQRPCSGDREAEVVLQQIVGSVGLYIVVSQLSG